MKTIDDFYYFFEQLKKKHLGTEQIFLSGREVDTMIYDLPTKTLKVYYKD